MEAIRLFKLLNRDQRNTFAACFLGWTLDAFDFLVLTFVIVPMAHDFGTSIADLSYAITISLAMRPVGAFIFGLLGDRFGRRIPLMIDIIFYSVMAVSIRLRREGSKNRPYYRVVVADSRGPRDGKFIEILGTYDPKLTGQNSSFSVERAEYWMSKGARPSDTVRSLIKKQKKTVTAEPASEPEPESSEPAEEDSSPSAETTS